MSGNQLSRGEGSERLRARRRRARKYFLILLGFLTLVLIGACIWWLWQPSARISSITVYGAPQSLASYASTTMSGSYLHIVPRDSSFFYPASQIRREILASDRGIAAVSLFTEGFTALSIKVINRVPVAHWCGLAPTPGVEPYCYVFDASGYIYNTASTTDSVLNSFTFYDSLAVSSTEPLGATLADAGEVPDAFNFARELPALGGSVQSVVIRGDEVDDIIASSTTRVTYVLGDEQAAYAALASAKGDYDLTDGSVQYIDLRFPAKIYLKKKE